VEGSDDGWGVREISVTYSLDGTLWQQPDMLDFKEASESTIRYSVWIRAPNQNTTLTIRAVAEDFAGHTSSPVSQEVAIGALAPPERQTEPESKPELESSPEGGIPFLPVWGVFALFTVLFVVVLLVRRRG